MPAAIACIDSRALLNNLGVVKKAAPKARVMAVIKANAYGHGLTRIAEVLADKVDALAVARLDEAIVLRQQGIQVPVTVLQGFNGQQELAEFLQYRLTAVIHCVEQIQWLENSIKKDKLPVWLKMDTGMNRLGFKADEWALAYQRLKNCNGVQQPVGQMTHLADSDRPQAIKTGRQVAAFLQLTDAVAGDKSIANSAAILSCPESIVDWVRPGLMLYGCSPFGDKTAAEYSLKPVMTLKSQVIAVKNINIGETVGYGSTWPCRKRGRIAVIAIGYGDGYPRYARSGTPVLVNGCKVPLVGRVSMDMITVELPASLDVHPGDEAVLWGAGLPVEEIAAWAGTIPYTLVCGITSRVQIIEQ